MSAADGRHRCGGCASACGSATSASCAGRAATVSRNLSRASLSLLRMHLGGKSTRRTHRGSRPRRPCIRSLLAFLTRSPRPSLSSIASCASTATRQAQERAKLSPGDEALHWRRFGRSEVLSFLTHSLRHSSYAARSFCFSGQRKRVLSGVLLVSAWAVSHPYSRSGSRIRHV